MNKNNFLHWLAGFSDGEGYFGVSVQKHPSGNYYFPEFCIKLRSDDKKILSEIVDVVGFGKFYPSMYGGRQSKFSVRGIPQCLELIKIFDKYPLRAKKKRDYEIWRKIVFLLKSEGTQISQKTNDLVVDLKSVRMYRTSGG